MPPPRRRFLVIAALCAAVASCGREEPAADVVPSDVVIGVETGRITAPDSVPPGWSRIRVNESGGSHIVVVFRLHAATSDADVATFVAALDTTPATPASGVAMGGPEVGQSGEVIMYFTPGRYVLGCLSRSDGDHRHATLGESKSFVVPDVAVESLRGFPPVATHEMKMTEFAYGGSAQWRAGPQVVRIENTGSQDHQLRLLKLATGSSLSDWMNSDGSVRHGTAVAGLARTGAGQVAYLPVDLEPGSYVAYCLIADPTRRKAHIELGMMREIKVE